jgi:hypothetical protein
MATAFCTRLITARATIVTHCLQRYDKKSAARSATISAKPFPRNRVVFSCRSFPACLSMVLWRLPHGLALNAGAVIILDGHQPASMNRNPRCPVWRRVVGRLERWAHGHAKKPFPPNATIYSVTTLVLATFRRKKCDKTYHGREASIGLFAAGGDASKSIDLTEEVFDEMTPPVLPAWSGIPLVPSRRRITGSM